MVLDSGDYQAAINALEKGNVIITTGMVDAKRAEPIRVLSAAADQHRLAQGLFGRYGGTVPANAAEAARYHRLEDSIANLKEEVRGYARKVVEGVVNDLGYRVSSLKAAIDKERIRYEARFGMLPRVSAIAVINDVDNARQMADDQSDYVGRIKDELNAQGLYNNVADDGFFNEAFSFLGDAKRDISKEEDRHKKNVDNADIKKTDAQWGKEQKRHLNAIRKKKLF